MASEKAIIDQRIQQSIVKKGKIKKLRESGRGNAEKPGKRREYSRSVEETMIDKAQIAITATR